MTRRFSFNNGSAAPRAFARAMEATLTNVTNASQCQNVVASTAPRRRLDASSNVDFDLVFELDETSNLVQGLASKILESTSSQLAAAIQDGSYEASLLSLAAIFGNFSVDVNATLLAIADATLAIFVTTPVPSAVPTAVPTLALGDSNDDEELMDYVLELTVSASRSV